jgi:hypothetical protein
MSRAVEMVRLSRGQRWALAAAAVLGLGMARQGRTRRSLIWRRVLVCRCRGWCRWASMVGLSVW